MLRRFAVPVGTALAALLSIVLAGVGVGWWELPLLLAVAALTLRILVVSERTGTVVVTMKRNDERVRALDKMRHTDLVAAIADARIKDSVRGVKDDSPQKIDSTVPVRPFESIVGPPSSEFSLQIPQGSESLALWLEVGSFDILAGEFTVEVSTDVEKINHGEVASHRANTLVRLDDVAQVGQATRLQVKVARTPGIDTGLPPHLAFAALVAIIEHPLVPQASVRVLPKISEEAQHE